MSKLIDTLPTSILRRRQRPAVLARAALAAGGLFLGSLASLLGATTTPARADTLVLVQGYLGSAGSWRASGIVPILHQRGWTDAGHLYPGPGWQIVSTVPDVKSTNRLYTLDLPTEAPVALQAQVLSASITEVARRYPGEKIAVAAHSAGGVVARYAMVTNSNIKIATLITIASPHLGTSTAELGSAIANSPLSWVAPFVGLNTINRSQVLYRDLWRDGPFTMLGWLNRQPHPTARYVSVIRTTDVRAPYAGDSVVHGWSQDMNMVPALAGRAERFVSPGEHGLRTDDGLLIADILATHAVASAAQH
ncbi:MAG: hypothetical protein KDJ47_11765 [Hyphomicrobiaceae bacterium]|nr:hypothetical protein [Hyphomicrobiaceae bacterium]